MNRMPADCNPDRLVINGPILDKTAHSWSTLRTTIHSGTYFGSVFRAGHPAKEALIIHPGSVKIQTLAVPGRGMRSAVVSPKEPSPSRLALRPTFWRVP